MEKAVFDLVVDLKNEKDKVMEKIHDLSCIYSKMKHQQSMEGILISLQIATLSQYAQLLQARIQDTVAFDSGVELTSAAGFMCSKDTCEGCEFDPDECVFDADRNLTDDDAILEIVDEDEDIDEDEDVDEDDDNICDGDCADCPFAGDVDEDDDEDYEDDEDDEDDEDGDSSVTVIVHGDGDAAEAFIDELVSKIITDEGKPDLVKKASEKKVVSSEGKQKIKVVKKKKGEDK